MTEASAYHVTADSAPLGIDSFGALPSVSLPDVGTSTPTDRTQYVRYPQADSQRKPLSRPMPAYQPQKRRSPWVTPSRRTF